MLLLPEKEQTFKRKMRREKNVTIPLQVTMEFKFDICNK